MADSIDKQDTIEYYDEDEYYDEEDERAPSRLESLARGAATGAVNHPRILVGSLSSLLGIGADIAYHEPLWVLFGLGIAAVLGLTSDQAKTLRLIALGADHDASETITDLSNSLLGEPPEDQSLRAKFARLFQRKEVETPLPQKRVVRNLPGSSATREEALTYDRIISWFEQDVIDDVQLIRLLDHLARIEKRLERDRDAHAHADIVEHEAAPEANGPANGEPSRPPGWDEEKEQWLIGAYMTNGNYCKCLEIIGFSDTQRNRDYARDILKKKGLLKGK